MKMEFSFKTPIGYAIAGSFFLHIILVSMYGTLLTSGDVSPPPPPKKIRIEIVDKKPKPTKKVKVKEKRIIKPKMIAPVIIKKPRSARSAQKIIKKEIALQPVLKMVPTKTKMALDQNINSSKKSFQMVKANIPASSVVAKPRTIEKLPTSEITTLKVQRTSIGKAKLADISPLPRPVENVRIFSKDTGKEASFHVSAVSFAPSTPKPKSVAVASFSSNGMDQKKAVEFKSSISSRSAVSALAAIRPSAPEFESVTTPNRAARFYETKTRTVSTLPSARVSSITLPSGRMSGNNTRTGFVQKGELIASSTFPRPRPVPDIVDPGILDGYLGTLQKLIASAKQYPESARKSGREGRVTVQFTVLKNGAVKNIQLVSKTNYSDLDEEAIEAVKRAAPFSGFPEEIGKPFLDIILPFRFKINE
jgi:TonB family protein